MISFKYQRVHTCSSCEHRLRTTRVKYKRALSACICDNDIEGASNRSIVLLMHMCRMGNLQWTVMEALKQNVEPKIKAQMLCWE